MVLTKREAAQLHKLIELAQDLLSKAEISSRERPVKSLKAKAVSKRTRRSGKELAAFRKMLKAERKKGVPVEQIAREHGVSASYIYQIA
ncbi:MAG: hypothetical protein K0S56_620 [Microvirga sp.]|nr:hypothetical protein [Microvirga sp.]